jgi:predicted secreted protein
MLAIPAVGCALAAGTLILTEADEGKTIDLAVGQQAELKLGMSGGTGYTWTLDETDGKVITVGERRTETGDDPNKIGGPVTVVYPITGAGKGTAKLTARLIRPWMADKPAKTMAFTVTVK